MNKIVIDAQACKGCNLCVTECPKKALAPGKTMNKKGYHFPDTVAENCIACGSCERVCPDFAIYVVKEG